METLWFRIALAAWLFWIGAAFAQRGLAAFIAGKKERQ
jgi:hypothetical protein